MNGAQLQVVGLPKTKSADEQAELRCHKQAFRAELYALAVLVGQGMVVVYVIGTLVVNCIRT